MTIDQIIDTHDSILAEVTDYFPKPIGRHAIKGKPKLSLVKQKKKEQFTSNEYLEKRMAHFFSDMVTKAVLGK